MLAKGQHGDNWRAEDVSRQEKSEEGSWVLLSSFNQIAHMAWLHFRVWYFPCHCAWGTCKLSIWQALLSNILWFQPCKWLLEHAKGQKVGLGHAHWLTQRAIRQPQLPEQPSAIRVGHKIYLVCIANKVKCLWWKLLRRWGSFLAQASGAC